ncbi:MFS transporter [Andreprevotia chitinilytica]|uniref:MFS transporter n=1 Tax=Andreprevotia chitinilytica TaxID=396808 RepID=UPI001FE0623B|nr:MFS transporter [Andreprevotia chitinilytica]
MADFIGWRMAGGFVGGVGLLASMVFWRKLPASRYFVARPLPFTPAGLAALRQAVVTVWRDPGLPWLFAMAFVLMGCFVSLYNYIGFYLEAPPFGLSPSVIGLIFTLYLVGVVSSVTSGHLAQRFGRSRAMLGLTGAMLCGLVLTLFHTLPVVIVGAILFTFSFFGGHAIASGWVGQRSGQAKALAAAFYMSSYYVGSSLIGSTSGLFWASGHWAGVVGVLAVTLVVGLAVIRFRLARLPG